MPHKPFTRLYKALLRLYPRSFQAEFAEEMISVFEEALGEAASRGWLAQLRRLLVEVLSLPAGVLQISLKNQPVPNPKKPGGLEWEGPPSSWESLVALAVFVLPVANLWLNSVPQGTSFLLLLCMASLLAGCFVIGLKSGFPRWSLPYLGLALSALSFVFVFQWASDRIAPSLLPIPTPLPQDESLTLLLQSVGAGMMWLSLFAMTFLFLGLLALVHRFHPLLARLRQDWTLVSYILYSGTLFTLGFTFDQYHAEQPYTLASSLCLVTGAWLYLRSRRPWQRTLALLAGITLAMGSSYASQWPAVLAQDWYAARQTILAWGWMVLALLAPALIKLPKVAKDRSPAAG